MSERDPRLYLDIIIESVERVREYVDGVDYKEYVSDQKLQDAVNMRLQVIGENVSKLPGELLDDWDSVTWNKVISLRHLISHDYDKVFEERIWEVVENHLDELDKVVKEMLESLGG